MTVTLLAAIADPGKLARVVLYSLVFGVGISAVVGLGVSSAAGLLDAMRTRRVSAVLAWASLATLCMAVVVAAIVVGIVVMSTK